MCPVAIDLKRPYVASATKDPVEQRVRRFGWCDSHRANLCDLLVALTSAATLPRANREERVRSVTLAIARPDPIDIAIVAVSTSSSIVRGPLQDASHAGARPWVEWHLDC